MQQIKNIVHLMILIAVILLSGIGVSYGQQNTGASPYLGSEHSYRVSIGLTANDQFWIITDKGANTYDLTTTPQSWASITSATSNGGYDVIQVYFDRSVFSVGTWYLQFYEYQDMGGSTICTSAREFPISVVENTFYLTLAADVNTQCNSQDGEIHPLSEVQDAGDVYDTDVTYTITMSKNDAFDPTYWEFDAQFSQSVSAISATTTDGAVNVSTITAGTDYNLVVTPSATNPSSVTVKVTVTYSNTVLTNVTNTITVTNGQAVVEAPPAPDAVTDDNIVTYADGTPNRVQAITILKIPSTQDITFGAGETATTAQNPMLLSTHKYVVTMENVANSSDWHIENAAGTYTLVLNTDYTLTENTSATADTATISFINKSLPTGNYVIYFTETDATTGCSTVRPYPIAIQPPFDVDIAAVGDGCNGLSGVINNPPLANGDTEVVYVVSLITSGYDNSWSFDFLVTCPELGGTLTLSSIAVSDADQATISNGGTVTVTRGATQVNTSVTLKVTYSGLYAANHTVTATLPDGSISGSFGETDANDGVVLEDVGVNEGEINQARHIIYALPQPGALTGIN